MVMAIIPDALSAGLGCLWQSPEGCMFFAYQGIQYVDCGDGYYSEGLVGEMGECPGIWVPVY